MATDGPAEPPQEAQGELAIAADGFPAELLELSRDFDSANDQNATHPRTLMERYRLSPFMKVQDVSKARILRQVIVRTAITHAIISSLILLFLKFYDPRDLPPEPRTSDRSPQEEWEVGPLQAMEDMSVTKWSLFCPGIRWAQTAEQTGFMSFWLAFWSMSFLWLIKWFYFWICTWFMLFDLTGFLTLVHRRRLRHMLKLPAGPLTWLQDCGFSFFCAFNVIAHEARVVKAMAEKGEAKGESAAA